MKYASPTKRNFKSLHLILCAAAILLIAAMFLITRRGQADAGIGQPVTLGPPQVFPTGSGPYAIAAYRNDFLFPVLAVANNANDTVTVVRQTENNAGLNSSTNYSLPSGAHPQGISVGIRRQPFTSPKEFLVVADTGINKVSVLLQETINTFQQPVHYDVGSAPQDVAADRLIGDNNTDIVAANFGSNNITILAGNNDGTFGNPVTFNVSPGPRGVVVGLLDDNFNSDIATCSSDAGAGKVTVLLATAGTFLSGGIYDVGSDPHDIASGDLNLDGKQDLVTANTGSNDVSVLINTGSGAFAAAKSYNAGTTPRSVSIGDLNRDGKPDLAVASANGLNLLFNNGDGTFGCFTESDRLALITRVTSVLRLIIR